MQSSNLNIRINDELKDDVVEILKSKGLNVSQVVNMMFHYIEATKRVPFELIEIPNKNTIEAIREAELMVKSKKYNKKSNRINELHNKIIG